jgi:transcriptional regulator with XRE-family HTH domain
VTAIRITDAKQIAGVIGDLRVLNRLTQRQLAEDTRTNQGQIHEWLHGNRTPNADSLIRLANALGYDLALVPREEE